MIKQLENIGYKAGGLFTATIGSVLSASNVYAQAQEPEDCDISSGGISGGANCAAPDNARGDLFGEGGIFSTISNILLFLVGAISVIMLIVGGIRYVISAGDQNAVTGAKNTILYAIVGIIVSFLAYAAVNFVVGQLNEA